MEKILGFSDIHLGIRTHSTLCSSGLYEAEIEGRIALDEIYRRSCQDDIFAIILAGDMFHTSNPTSENVRFFVGWLEAMDSLNKQIIIIPGNHDASMHSHSMVFIHELNFKNVLLIDLFNDYFSPTADSIIFGNWNIVFAPYVTSDSAKDKEQVVYNYIDTHIKKSSQPTILVTHIHEYEAKIGSESLMLSKKVPYINFDNYNVQDDIILLSGHIHRHQVYNKNNGIKVVYPGSLYYHDKHDVNQDKGYVLINKNGEIEFETIKNIRKFVSYKIPEDGNVLQFLKSFRLGTNRYVFLNAEGDEAFDEKVIRTYLESCGCKLGGIIYKTSDMVFESDINVNYDETDPYIAFNKYLDDVSKIENLKYLDELKNYSEACITEAKGIK